MEWEAAVVKKKGRETNFKQISREVFKERVEG